MGRKSDARARLIECGCDLMHEKGFTAVGVSEVCDRANVHKGSFYHFFPSKRDLGLAVIDSHWTAHDPLLEEMIEGPGAPLERFMRFFRKMYERHDEMKRETGKVLGCPLGNLALEMSTQDDELRQKLRELFERQVDRFEAVLSEAVERGDLPPSDTRKRARSVMSLIEGGIMMAKMDDDPEPLRDLGDDALRLVGAPGN